MVGKPAVLTHVADNMTANLRPTRAEATDVANAVLDGLESTDKSKNVVKLQAVVRGQAPVRGHLVRRHVVGTLQCVQAIVKMQLLMRARQARQSHSNGKNDY